LPPLSSWRRRAQAPYPPEQWGNFAAGLGFVSGPNHNAQELSSMRGILLWLIGIPIPIIILLYLFNVL
jgi:hypothetical protein